NRRTLSMSFQSCITYAMTSAQVQVIFADAPPDIAAEECSRPCPTCASSPNLAACIGVVKGYRVHLIPVRNEVMNRCRYRGQPDDALIAP
ncbi:hypothetical protein, partial [Mesorhizobium caraganae]|uniref:hypothetical protein n=1 Tax=Mesorhizobium caraganae TaxID=483206 RepID=UPI001AED5538